MAPGQTLLYLSLFPCLASAFNLDTDNVILRKGERDSLFGFSLAMHWQLQPQDKRLLLVGAPRERAFPSQQANRTGGLYSCDITSPETHCTRVLFDENADPATESKEDQWMGVTVQSQGPGGKVVTCAHRYEKRQYVNTVQESRDIIGRCYLLSQDLTIKDPKDDESAMDGGEWSFCDGRLRGHEKFGSCQQGVAATFTRDYHYVVFGAPGTYNWKGVVRAEQKNQTFYALDIFDDGPYEVGSESRRAENLVPVPANSYLGLLFLTSVSDTDPDQFVYKTLPPNVRVDKSTGVMMNSYLGFSLDTGKGIVSQEETTFVSGAPRANHSGAVVLLKKDTQIPRALSLVHIFEGEGLASSFGYDVAVVDLNNDGWQDIVVGAPQYFDRDGEIGGAVYIYINQQGKWEGVKPIRLNGTTDSMFGIAVENIGDINQDGFPDIAVGAPYDDFGKVFIYHGSKNGINTKPAQILDGKKSSVQYFGYSITGNMDLDRNSYPDIAVGSLSDSVSVYRSRPVISIKKTIKISPDKIDLNRKTCLEPSGICMAVEACFEYIANPKDFNPKIKLNYTFEAENDRRRLGLPSRVQFSEHLSDQFIGSIILGGQNRKECVTTSLVMQENIKDKLRPIPVSVGVKISGSESNLPSKRRQGRSLPDLVPILNSNEPETVNSEVQFLKEGCGEDNICNSNLKLQYRFCTREGNEGRFAYLPIENNVPVLVLKDQKDIALEITVTNNPSDAKNLQKDGEDAHEAKLVATFPDSLTYSSFRELRAYPEKQLTCGANQNGSEAECELGNPFKRNSNVTFYLILSTTKVNVDTTDLDVNLKLETTSNQVNLAPITATAKVVIELLLSLTGVAKPSQVYFGGNVIGESAMESEDDVGNVIEYEFRITNLGRPLKTFGTASLDIQWPKEINNGKWLLYLMKVDSKELAKIPCEPKNEINFLQLKESHRSRRKREVAEKQTNNGKKMSLFSERKYKTLDCNVNVRCVNIKCPLQGLDRTALVVLRSRLWNSTFLEEYSTLNYLDILVRAKISVPAAAENIKLTNEAAQVRLTVFPAKTVALHTGVPWWIILVAILAGILMLALLVFLLWKCGFFQRSRYDDSVPRYHAVRIRKEERQIKDGKHKENLEKKQWITKWNENESYS
ncbi:integrin alpha-6 isoform X1 [Terrapene carolina triunguis]|uniref:integrin alpha-6 isoform X1 n=1 Tax=Terrapene triunguis TaxID=2587831 RepID=UPI000CEFADAF|nr:integrin alpha-6 isoform X1 [Terrapene carolina triunguis]